MSSDLTSEYFESMDINIGQPKRGHRYGEESIALANFCKLEKNNCAAELGSGVGVISLMIAARDMPQRIVAVEIQKSLHDIAVKNVSENNLGKIVSCVNADWTDYAQENRALFDVVFSNPPFYKVRGRMSPKSQRAMARHEMNGTIKELIFVAKTLLKVKGRLMIVFAKERRGELTQAAISEGFLIKRMENESPSAQSAYFLAEFENLAE